MNSAKKKAIEYLLNHKDNLNYINVAETLDIAIKETKRNKFLRFCIEFWGYLGLIILFGCIWIEKFRWNLFFTWLVCWHISYLLNEVNIDMEKKKNKGINRRRNKRYNTIL